MLHLKHKIPPSLRRDLRACGDNFRHLARLRGVNVYWVSRLIQQGEEPKNKEIRLKLSLSARPRKVRRPAGERLPKPPTPEHVRWWRKLSKEAREKVIQSVHAGFLEYQEKKP